MKTKLIDQKSRYLRLKPGSALKTKPGVILRVAPTGTKASKRGGRR